MRRLLAAGLCTALQVGAFTAPLVHAHLDGHHRAHHEAGVVHAHVEGHSDGPAGAGHHAPASGASGFARTTAYVASGFSRTTHQPAVGSHDDAERATRLQIFVAVASAAFGTPALPPAPFTLVVAIESGTRRPPGLVRSHGPPDLGRAAPRAPPAASVLI